MAQLRTFLTPLVSESLTFLFSVWWWGLPSACTSCIFLPLFTATGVLLLVRVLFFYFTRVFVACL